MTVLDKRVIGMDSPVDPKEASESVTGDWCKLMIRTKIVRFFITYIITWLDLNHHKHVH